MVNRVIVEVFIGFSPFLNHCFVVLIGPSVRFRTVCRIGMPAVSYSPDRVRVL